MNAPLFFPCGDSPALHYACRILQKSGVHFIDHPTPEVDYLLTDTPCKTNLIPTLEMLPESITVIGGNLDGLVPNSVKAVDLLKMESYLWSNAAITARCAIRIASEKIHNTLEYCPILIIGYGRIGIHLAELLKALGADITVAARSTTARAIAESFRLRAIPIESAPQSRHYSVIFNTVPALLYSCEQFTEGIIIDLASKPGISGSNVIAAKGLPGKIAPETSGTLIAKSVISML